MLLCRARYVMRCVLTVHAGHNPICAGVTDVETDIRLSDVAARLAAAGIHVVAISVGDNQLDSPMGTPLGDCPGPAGGQEATAITTRTNGKLYSGIYTSTIVQVGGAVGGAVAVGGLYHACRALCANPPSLRRGRPSCAAETTNHTCSARDRR